MSPNDDSDDDPDTTGLDALTRNRYFFGKLMTPRDMHTEQAYHVGRSTMQARFVTGAGIVHGLGLGIGIEEAEPKKDGSLHVTIKPGLAVDPDGHQIVVDRKTTKPIRNADETDPDAAFALPDDDVLLYLARTDIEEEPVPVPGAESVPEGTEEYNRVRESFELRYREVDLESVSADAGLKVVPPVEYPRVPDLTDVDSSEDLNLAYARALNRLVDEYDGAFTEEAPDAAVVLVGALKQTRANEWEVVADTALPMPLPSVYSNDMLYAAVSRLALETRPVDRWLLRSVARNTRDSFARLDEAFETEPGEGITGVDDIIEAADDWLKDEIEKPDSGPREFLDMLDEIKKDQKDLSDEIEDLVSDEDDLDRFKNATDELETVLDGRPTPVRRDQLLHYAALQEVVNDTTTWLVED